MYISRLHICFHAKSFGMNKKVNTIQHNYPHSSDLPFILEQKIIDIGSIDNIQKEGDTDILLFIRQRSEKFSFPSQQPREEAFDIMTSLWTTIRGSQGLRVLLKDNSQGEKSLAEIETVSQDLEDSELLSRDDWVLLLKGAKFQTFKKDECIVTQGQLFQRIYTVEKGSCRVEISNKFVGIVEEGQM